VTKLQRLCDEQARGAHLLETLDTKVRQLARR